MGYLNSGFLCKVEQVMVSYEYERPCYQRFGIFLFNLGSLNLWTLYLGAVSEW